MKQKFFYLIILFYISISSTSQTTCFLETPIPFSTDSINLTIWNGEVYIPFFIKGVNLGVSLPGKFPGELEVSREQYSRWFQMIKDAGFNSIRLYTMHYPHFYEVLDSFNTANYQNPLFFFQGVWLEEEHPDFDGNLYNLTEVFKNEIEENIDCVHGNRYIEERQGKAHGLYSHDVSKWNIGYIIGREVYPEEVLYTDEVNQSTNSNYIGIYFSIWDATPSELWFTKKLDHLLTYEYVNYNTQRPVSISSWPTLDPLTHPNEWNPFEDTVSIDMNKLDFKNAPAGYFASYHAYPYYPDFISNEPLFQEYSDFQGPNSYLGYLTYLKKHYNRFPLIIAEYGVPSSWGNAHYSHSGMHQGGHSELEQGFSNIRILNNIEKSLCGGGIQFAWMDEWFKQTWITDPIDYLTERRILWHNIAAAEQNYGLIGFNKPDNDKTFLFDCDTCLVREIKASVDYAFFNLEIDIKEVFEHPDEMWIAFDTYSEELGESILPTGDTLDYRSEFALHITNYSAILYVTQAYDIFEIWHGWSGPQQLYQSIPTDGEPWKIVRWRNNELYEEVQYIGNLQINNGFYPYSSKDAVTINNNKILVKIPWSLINVVDPSSMRVFHDDRNTPQPEDTISDGFAISVLYKNNLYSSNDRYTWELWNLADNTEEYKKISYYVMQNNLHLFNNPAIAICNKYYIDFFGEPVFVDSEIGVLSNDFDMDGNYIVSVIIDNAMNGNVNLFSDGSFYYIPNQEFSGIDYFTYSVFDGHSLSEPATVFIDVYNWADIDDYFVDNNELKISVYPEPANNYLSFESNNKINSYYIFDINGKMLKKEEIFSFNHSLSISELNQAMYLIKFNYDNKKIVKRFNVVR